MKRAISIILAITLIFALTTGCGKKEAENPITEVKVTIPCSTGSRAIVEGEAVIATQVYLLSRAYFEKLETYDMDSFNAQEYSDLLAEAQEAFRVAEALCDSFESHAGSLADMEENESVQQEKATYELLSASTDSAQSSALAAVAYAAEEESPAVRFAEELTKTFDSAKNGQKLKAIAEKYGTDVKKAKAMLDQAQAILEGAAYEDQAAFENKCYEAAVETKAASSAIGFGVACMASGGLTLAGGASIAGVAEAGGIVCSGLNAVIDMGTAITIHLTNGEGNELTADFEKASEVLAPATTVFGIAGGIQNIKDFRNPEKAVEAVDNAAQAFLVGLGLARDYVQDGTVLGVSSNIIDGYREIIVRSADTSNPEAAKEVLLKTGISEEALEDVVSTAEQAQDGHLGAEADAYIEAMGEIADPKNPIDVDEFIENVDKEFQICLAAEGAEVSGTNEDEDTESKIENKSNDSKGDNAEKKSVLLAADVAGSYYFPELEDSAKIDISVSDDSHLTLTDVDNGESFVGDYDETTGVFRAVLSDRFKWYVTVTFTDTGHGIQAVLEEALGGTSVTSSAMKE